MNGPDELSSHPTDQPDHHAERVADPTGTFTPLGDEPVGRRLRQHTVLAFLACAAVACAVWLMWSWLDTREAADHNAQAAAKLCRQVNRLGQPCITQPSADGLASDAVVPGVTAGLTGSPVTPAGRPPDTVPTDDAGVALPFQPGTDAMVTAVTVEENRLILTYSDGARLDAGPVDAERLAIVLRTTVSSSPSPSPSPVEPAAEPSVELGSPTDTASPTGTPAPEETP